MVVRSAPEHSVLCLWPSRARKCQRDCEEASGDPRWEFQAKVIQTRTEQIWRDLFRFDSFLVWVFDCHGEIERMGGSAFTFEKSKWNLWKTWFYPALDLSLSSSTVDSLYLFFRQRELWRRIWHLCKIFFLAMQQQARKKKSWIKINVLDGFQFNVRCRILFSCFGNIWLILIAKLELFGL